MSDQQQNTHPGCVFFRSLLMGPVTHRPWCVSLCVSGTTMCSTVSQRAPTLWRPTENWKTQTPIWISPNRCYWETPQFRKPSEHQNIIFWRVQPSVFRSVYNTSCFKHTHKIFTCWGCFPLHFWSNLWPRTFMVSSPRRRRNRLQKPRSQKWLHRLRRRRLQKPRSQKWLQFVASEISIFPNRISMDCTLIAPFLSILLTANCWPFAFRWLKCHLHQSSFRTGPQQPRVLCCFGQEFPWQTSPWTEVCQASFCWNMAQLCSQEEGGQSQT